MKLLAIADKNPHIDIVQTVRSQGIELAVTLGDLTREDILGLKQLAIPKIGVYGNHCSGTYMPELGILDTHLKIWTYNGLRFGGFQGCVRYKENPQAIMYTQQEARQLMAGFPVVDVFLSHCPPFGVNDEPEEIAHQGFLALRDYLDHTPPKVWLHGHTYPAPERQIHHYGAARIEYVSGYRIITI